jgi:hypothetical protein
MMADTWSMFAAHNKAVPRVEYVLSNLEKTCRRHDKVVTRVIMVLSALVVWMIVADSFIPSTSLVFQVTWDTSTKASYVDESRSRTLHRVLSFMQSQCGVSGYDSDVVLAPQIYVNGKSYSKQAMVMCSGGTVFVNPTVAFRGDQSAVCVDEHDGVTKKSRRQYPIAVASANLPIHSLVNLTDVCAFSHAVDLLDAQWSA